MSMNIVVLGLGSELMGDDSAGLKVIDILKQKHKKNDVDFKKCFSTGFEVMEEIEGYDAAIIVDSICTGLYKKGEVVRLKPEDLRYSKRISSFHDFDLNTSIELGKKLRLKMPDFILIFGVEIEESYEFSDRLSPEVERAIYTLSGEIEKELMKLCKMSGGV
jgi:hydrogenase maturation protease